MNHFPEIRNMARAGIVAITAIGATALHPAAASAETNGPLDDADGDRVINLWDVHPGFPDDSMDLDGDRIPDYKDKKYVTPLNPDRDLIVSDFDPSPYGVLPKTALNKVVGGALAAPTEIDGTWRDNFLNFRRPADTYSVSIFDKTDSDSDLVPNYLDPTPTPITNDRDRDGQKDWLDPYDSNPYITSRNNTLDDLSQLSIQQRLAGQLAEKQLLERVINEKRQNALADQRVTAAKLQQEAASKLAAENARLAELAQQRNQADLAAQRQLQAAQQQRLAADAQERQRQITQQRNQEQAAAAQAELRRQQELDAQRRQQQQQDSYPR